MAEDKKDQKSTPINKKPKTDKQKEKERERRRKRRQKKKVKIGEDLSLFLSSKDEGIKSKGDFKADIADFEQDNSDHQERNYPIPELSQQSSKTNQSDDFEDQSLDLPQIPVVPDQNSSNLKDDVGTGHDEDTVFSNQSFEGQNVDLSFKDKEESEGSNLKENEVLDVSKVESKELDEENEQQEESILETNDEIDDENVEVDTPLDDENDIRVESSKNIFEETPVYESQKLNDDEEMDRESEEENVNNEENEKIDRVDEDDNEGNINNQEEAEIIRQSLINNNDSPLLEEETGGDWIISKLIKSIVSIVVIIILAIGAFWFGSKLHILDFVKGVFNWKKVEVIEGDNQNVTIDINMQKQLGFYGSKIFSRNLGDTRDLGYNVFFVAHYFGKLMDPVFYGETGITAALYYGYGQDSQYFENKFIYYVKLLGRIKEANKVDVNVLLNGKVDRDATLNAYLKELKGIFEEGNAMRKEINVQVDEFQISLASLNEDHDRYQNDFFAALNANLAEKSNELMKQFVLNSQKQVELKAKMAAMARLSQDYTDQLLKMQARIVGVEQNMDALISGVRFTEIPGSDLNLID